jgi:ABC-2 type transport system ATP-binding protein
LTSEEAVFTGGLTKTYKTFGGRPVTALDNVTLRIPRGVAFGLVGPNGAGKTTFSKALIGTVHPTSGVATVFGEPAGSCAARKKLGYVPECASAPEHLTARQLVEYHATLYGVNPAERRKRTDELLEKVELGSRSGERLGSFSKGMRQRAAIAAALIHRPQMLILDEPTEGLDPEGRHHVLDLLRRLNRDTGVTLLINSHFLGEIESLCHEVAMLNRGKLVRYGELRSLTARQGYSLTLSDVRMGLAAALRSRLIGDQLRGEAGHLMLTLPGRVELDWVLEQARAFGARIEALSARSGSLEEVYLEETRQEVAQK